MKHFRKLRFTAICALAVAAAAILGVSCGETKRGEYAKGSAFVACDEGFRKIMEEEIEVFQYQYPDAYILPFYLSENACIDSLKADKCQLIIVTRELTPVEIENIKKTQKRIVRQKCIAVDAVALIVNKECPVGMLTMQEIGQILDGTITRWAQLAVNDTSRIKIVFDNVGSSTVSYMRDKFLPQGKMISDNPNAFAQKTNIDVFEVVKKDPHALGIISVSWLGDNLQATKMPVGKRLADLQNTNDTVDVKFSDAVKVLKVRSMDNPQPFLPYQAYINSGEYPLFRKVYAISTASNSNVVHSFYAFLTGYVGQKIISLTGVMPYQVNKRIVQIK